MNESYTRVDNPELKEPIKKKKIILMVSVAVLLIAIVLTIIFVISYNKPEKKIKRLISNGNYEEAVEIYKSASDNDLAIKIEGPIDQCLTNIKSQFASKEIDYEKAVDYVNYITYMCSDNIKSKAKETADYIDQLETSRSSYEAGCKAMNDEDWIRAISYFKKVQDIDSDNYTIAQKDLKQSTDNYKTDLLSKANGKVTNNDLTGAISLLQNALDIVPEDVEINTRISEYRNQLRDNKITEALTTSKNYINSKDFISAINTINKAITEHGKDERLTTALNEYTNNYVDSILNKVKEAENKQEFDGAISILTEATKALPDNKTLSARLSEVRSTKEQSEKLKYKEQILHDAEEAFNNEGYEKAVSILQNAKNLSSDSDIIAKINYYKEFKPISISDYYKQYGTFDDNVEYIYVNERLDDNYNVSHSNSFSVDSGYVSFLIKDMGLSTLSGTIALPKGCTPDGFRRSAKLTISVDGQEVFRSNEFTNASSPQTFSVDITNAEIITISWSCEGGNIWHNWCYYATIYDGQFQK